MDKFAQIAELVKSWQKNKSVERTSPGSKNHYKVTYNDGTEKWTDDKPGDGKGGRREERLHERKQNRPSIKDAKAKLAAGYAAYVDGSKDEAGLKQVVDDVIVKVGREIAREVMGDFVREKGEVEGKAKEALGIIKARKMEKLRKKEGSYTIGLVAGLLRIAEEVVIKKLFVADFDDTLVTSGGSIGVKHGDGIEETMDSVEFAAYTESDGDSFDFGDFNNVSKPRVIKANMEKLKAAAADKSVKVAILTARPKGAASAVKKYMESLGINNVEIAALQSSNPNDKAKWIQDKIGEGIEEVEFTDDSKRNADAVQKMLGENPSIKGVVNNPARPKGDSDYEGFSSEAIFKSDAPTKAEVKIDKPKPKTEGQKPTEKPVEPSGKHEKPPSKPSGQSGEQGKPSGQKGHWWDDQTKEFQRDYCKNHPGSKFC